MRGDGEPPAVRVASPGDTEAVLAVERDAFGGDAEASLVAELMASDAFLPELSLLAEAGSPDVVGTAGRVAARIVGHVLFTRAWAGGVAAALLAPLAVASDSQGLGIGSALVREGLRRAGELGFGIALVLGHPGYYPRFGFRPAQPHGIVPPYPVDPPEAWMVVELRPGALERARGVVHVAEAFRHEELWRE